MPLTITVTVPDPKSLESFSIEGGHDNSVNVKFYDNEIRTATVREVVQTPDASEDVLTLTGQGSVSLEANYHLEVRSLSGEALLGVVVIDLFDHIRNLHKAGVSLHDIAVEAGMSLGELMDIIAEGNAQGE